MKEYSFYGFTCGQILFILIIEAIFFYEELWATLTEHVILGIAVFAITALSFFTSKKIMKNDARHFIQMVIGSTTVKLIIYVGLIAAILYLFSSNPILYIFFFFVSYLLVTTTEIVYLVRALHRKRNKAV
jgi:4-hydroxybenzoate polyprenyltransferase